jgi:hypothetical protein
MLVISRFFGMIIKMYFRQSEHNPPHIHVIYGEYIGTLVSKIGTDSTIRTPAEPMEFSAISEAAMD